MEISEYLKMAIQTATNICIKMRHEFLTPEHILFALLQQEPFDEVLSGMHVDRQEFRRHVAEHIQSYETIPDETDYHPEHSRHFAIVMNFASLQAAITGQNQIEVVHAIKGIFTLPDSNACYLLTQAIEGKKSEFLESLTEVYLLFQEEQERDEYYDLSSEDYSHSDFQEEKDAFPTDYKWKKHVICLNDCVENDKPLIGREPELERTIQVLCRMEKNNPLHIGEPGVGKTALVRGLVARIVKGDVPTRLKGCKIYQIDLGSMVAGTQFRGEFEERIKCIMDGIATEKNAIVYIDEIHNIVGSGRTTDNSMDMAELLKPYIENVGIRFIGSTTYAEFKKGLAHNQGLTRRFQQIDIAEPSVEETVLILEGLKKKFEAFHQVKYGSDVMKYAAEAAAKHISNRNLPDKAIDLIDEAGAYRATHPTEKKRQTVDKKLINEVLMKICRIEASALKDDSHNRLAEMGKNIKKEIFGQDEAVDHVVKTIMMAKAGLTDESKPLGSLLFVGPTGVGKTEIAKVLAKELGVKLLRFDMSEYAEKHAVAKLIGTPAGYVGYEDGGLLTDAIRKTPNCVLLLDEVEKAHQDIYDILLQVMDYARLTDNRGQKADFRNVVLIMTSNAGAQHASQANIGFGQGISKGEGMIKQVKRIFKPEFINRLSATIVFRDMDREMAKRILNKKLLELSMKLATKNVKVQYTEKAINSLLALGFSDTYGAREIDRIIARELKPLFMQELLFGKLRRGGEARVDADENGTLKLYL